MYEGCEYVETDLVAHKGICSVKFDRAASAADVADSINHRNQSMVRALIAHVQVLIAPMQAMQGAVFAPVCCRARSAAG